jgi:hypothetical protein
MPDFITSLCLIMPDNFARQPDDLDTRKSTGTSCQIEIHFMIKTTEYLLKYTLFRFHIFVRAIVLITKHNYKISTSFIKNNEKYCN